MTLATCGNSTGGCPPSFAYKAVVAQRLYRAYGVVRHISGTLPTDYGYTGQRADYYIKLVHMGARWYDPQLRRWISPDTIVPDPANPQSLNRYSYVFGNPLAYVDPSGYDPLDPAWEQAFYEEHGVGPTDADRQARLYSILFPGPVSGALQWTEQDWVFFHQNRVGLFMNIAAGRESLADFAGEIERLSEWYSPGEDEQFVWAIALLYGGVPYGTTRGGVIGQGFGGARVQVPECAGVNDLRCGWLTHGMAGFSPAVAEVGAENTHHYAGQLLAGYYLPGWAANGGTWVRETVQGIQSRKGPDQLDINMGEIATQHGRDLHAGNVSPWNLSGLLRRDLAGASGGGPRRPR